MDLTKIANLVVSLMENAKDMEALELFNKNQPLAFNLAKRASYLYKQRSQGTLSDYDEDDFTMEALLGLYAAAERFDPAKGYAFSTLATEIIGNKIRDLVASGRTRAKARMHTELDAPIGDDEEGESKLDYVSSDNGNEHLVKKDSASILKQAVEAATEGDERAREILLRLMTDGENFDYRTVGKEHGISHTMVQNIINKYASKIRRNFNRMNIGGYDNKGNLLDKKHVRTGELLPPGVKKPGNRLFRRNHSARMADASGT